MRYGDRSDGMGRFEPGAAVPGSFELRGAGSGLVELGPRGGPAQGQGAPRPSEGEQEASDEEVLGDYETGSWRWNDVGAMRYDVEMARRKRDEARFFSNVLLGTSGVRAGGAYVRDRAGQTAARILGGPVARTLLGPEVGVATFAGGVAARAEAEAWERKLERLQRRLAELERGQGR